MPTIIEKYVNTKKLKLQMRIREILGPSIRNILHKITLFKKKKRIKGLSKQVMNDKFLYQCCALTSA